MQVNKIAIAVFTVGCLIFSVQAQCVVIKPSNVALPTSAGELFSFDFVVSGAMNTSALAFQVTISIGQSGLDFNEPISKAMANAAGYWAFGNSDNANAFVENGNFVFGDFTTDAELLVNNDIMARYAFKWDGTEGNYTFTLDLNTGNSFVQKEDLGIEVLQFTPGAYSGNSNNFIVNVPEPSTLIIFLLGLLQFCLKKVARKHSMSS